MLHSSLADNVYYKARVPACFGIRLPLRCSWDGLVIRMDVNYAPERISARNRNKSGRAKSEDCDIGCPAYAVSMGSIPLTFSSLYGARFIVNQRR